MWRDHPFSQKNRTIERTVRVGDGGDREVCVYVGGGTKFEKRGFKIYEVLHKIGAPLCQVCKEP